MKKDEFELLEELEEKKKKKAAGFWILGGIGAAGVLATAIAVPLSINHESKGGVNTKVSIDQALDDTSGKEIIDQLPVDKKTNDHKDAILLDEISTDDTKLKIAGALTNVLAKKGWVEGPLTKDDITIEKRELGSSVISVKQAPEKRIVVKTQQVFELTEKYWKNLLGYAFSYQKSDFDSGNGTLTIIDKSPIYNIEVKDNGHLSFNSPIELTMTPKNDSVIIKPQSPLTNNKFSFNIDDLFSVDTTNSSIKNKMSKELNDSVIDHTLTLNDDIWSKYSVSAVKFKKNNNYIGTAFQINGGSVDHKELDELEVTPLSKGPVTINGDEIWLKLTHNSSTVGADMIVSISAKNHNFTYVPEDMSDPFNAIPAKNIFRHILDGKVGTTSDTFVSPKGNVKYADALDFLMNKFVSSTASIQERLAIISLLTGAKEDDSQNKNISKLDGSKLQPYDFRYWSKENTAINKYLNFVFDRINNIGLDDFAEKIFENANGATLSDLRTRIFTPSSNDDSIYSLDKTLATGPATGNPVTAYGLGLYEPSHQSTDITSTEYRKNIENMYNEFNSIKTWGNATDQNIVDYDFLKLIPDEDMRNSVYTYVNDFMSKHTDLTNFKWDDVKNDDQWKQFANDLLLSLGLITSVDDSDFKKSSDSFTLWNVDLTNNTEIDSILKDKNIEFNVDANRVQDATTGPNPIPNTPLIQNSFSGWHMDNWKFEFNIVMRLLFSGKSSNVLNDLKTPVGNHIFDESKATFFLNPVTSLWQWDKTELAKVAPTWGSEYDKFASVIKEYFNKQASKISEIKDTTQIAKWIKTSDKTDATFNGKFYKLKNGEFTTNPNDPNILEKVGTVIKKDISASTAPEISVDANIYNKINGFEEFSPTELIYKETIANPDGTHETIYFSESSAFDAPLIDGGGPQTWFAPFVDSSHITNLFDLLTKSPKIKDYKITIKSSDIHVEITLDNINWKTILTYSTSGGWITPLVQSLPNHHLPINDAGDNFDGTKATYTDGTNTYTMASSIAGLEAQLSGMTFLPPVLGSTLLTETSLIWGDLGTTINKKDFWKPKVITSPKFDETHLFIMNTVDIADKDSTTSFTTNEELALRDLKPVEYTFSELERAGTTLIIDGVEYKYVVENK